MTLPELLLDNKRVVVAGAILEFKPYIVDLV